MGGQADTVISDPALGEVVGTDLLRTVARPHLATALGRRLRVLLCLGDIVKTGAQYAERSLLVLQLRLLVLARHHQPGGDMREPDGRVGGIDRLTPGPGGATDGTPPHG